MSGRIPGFRLAEFNCRGGDKEQGGDRVHYALPFFPFGEVGLRFNKANLDQIFTIRRAQLEKKFGSAHSKSDRGKGDQYDHGNDPPENVFAFLFWRTAEFTGDEIIVIKFVVVVG